MGKSTDLRQRLAASESLFTAWIATPEPIIAGALAYEAFDAVTLDLQHGAIDQLSAVRSIAAIVAAQKPAIVRVPVGEFQTASKMLDCGASGIIAPMINSAEDAKAFVSFVKYNPVGERSWGPSLSLPLVGWNAPDYFGNANDFVLAIPMIETKAALNALDDILAVPGVDGVFIGPSDLSIALFSGKQVNPTSSEVDTAFNHVVTRARAHKKYIFTMGGSGQQSAKYAKMGANMIAIGHEVFLLRMSAQRELAAARGKAS